MRHFTLTLLWAALWAVRSFGQCELTATVNQIPEGQCTSGFHTFMGFATGWCDPSPIFHYTWEAYIEGPTGFMQLDPTSTTTGTAPSPTSIPIYTYIGNAPVQVCLVLEQLDSEGNTITSDTACLGNIFNAPPLTIVSMIFPNSCSNSTCIQLDALGGSPPYQYSVNGANLNNNGYGCFNEPGVYVATVTDSFGCTAVNTVVIEPTEPSNASCETAVALTAGVTLFDTLCFSGFDLESCLPGQYFQESWYSLFSGDNSILQLGFTGQWPGTVNSSMGGLMEVYASTGDCSSLELIHCAYTDSCESMAAPIEVLPNTSYYIRYLTSWTSISTVFVTAILGDEALQNICGCTNSSSCNFDPEALIEDFSCGWNGCTDPGACNYQQWATCDDGSCVFGTDISGFVFHDVNGNGVRDSWPIVEPGIGGVGMVVINELDIHVIADASGNFLLPSIDPGVYTVSFFDSTGQWQLYSNIITIMLPSCNGLNIPLVSSGGAAMQLGGNLNSWGANIHCTNGAYMGVWVHNIGSTVISGSINVQFDPALTAEPGYGTSFISFTSGGASWEGSLQPGESHYYTFFIQGPGVDYVGDYFTFTTDVSFSSNASIFFENQFTSTSLVSCAYDPNDKQALPAGYTDAHYIAAGTELEYRIRFQNTGNAPAFDVIIEDEINLDQFELSSLQTVGASHSYSTIIEPDGRVKFVFNNIMLPDSGSDFAGSQGYVLFKIRTRQELLHQQQIANTAAIYFDQNPPIITNTYVHTIFDCEEIQALPTEGNVCSGLSYVLETTPDWIESYTWWNDDTIIGTESYIVLNEETPGSEELILVRENPLCTVYDTVTVTILPIPESTLTYENDMLIASQGDVYHWFFNGTPLENVSTQQLEFPVPGVYQVVVSFATGCNTTSIPVTVVGTESLDAHPILIWPQPATETVNIQLPEGSWNLHLYNTIGQEIRRFEANQGTRMIDVNELPSGYYVWHITQKGGMVYNLPMIKK